MTSVTESVKYVRAKDEESDSALSSMPTEKLCKTPPLAGRLARRVLSQLESESGRRWTLEELRDVLEVAAHGQAQSSAKILEGRYLRRRLSEQVALSEKYRDHFSLVVLTLHQTIESASYSHVVDALGEELRASDMLFLYKSRIAAILPRVRRAALETLLERVESKLAEAAVKDIATLVHPEDQLPDRHGVLDWAEDQLRDLPAPG